MLRIARREFRLKRKSKRIVVIILISAVLSTFFLIKIVKDGVAIDEGIYSANVPIGYGPFTISDNPDLSISDGVIYVKNTLKGYSAFDEFRSYVIREYNRWIYEKYGERAFPILIRLTEVSTKTPKVEIKKALTPPITEVLTPTTEVTKTPKPVKYIEREKIVKKVNVTESKTSRTEVNYVLPDELRPPLLLEKFVYAFLLVMPFYFISQIFSSSFMEDKVNRRFEVLLTILPGKKLILGKMIPYLILGTIVSFALSVAFGKILIMFLLLPVLLLMLSIDAFVVFLSRSYKEMSFISIVVTLLITAYMFIPAVFSFVPMSKLSPVTVVMDILKGENVDIYFFLSILHVTSISFVLIYLTSNSFEFMYAQSFMEKLINLTSKLTDRYLKVFTFTIASLPFVLIFELFAISIFYPVRTYVVPVLVSLAIIEEFFKGIFVYSSKEKLNPYVSALISAIAFFSGEKLILIPIIPYELSKMLLLPLIAHTASAIVFVLAMRWGFKTSVMSSAIVHASYNGVILWHVLTWL